MHVAHFFLSEFVGKIEEEVSVIRDTLATSLWLK